MDILSHLQSEFDIGMLSIEEVESNFDFVFSDVCADVVLILLPKPSDGPKLTSFSG